MNSLGLFMNPSGAIREHFEKIFSQLEAALTQPGKFDVRMLVNGEVLLIFAYLDAKPIWNVTDHVLPQMAFVDLRSKFSSVWKYYRDIHAQDGSEFTLRLLKINNGELGLCCFVGENNVQVLDDESIKKVFA